ncbi:hypothetical protein Barb6_02420 [Bacteroidales bacterium Barb6]|nr:hypothetical protein Barb6_02420 [Bacteroidales bacterium Barb6]
MRFATVPYEREGCSKGKQVRRPAKSYVVLSFRGMELETNTADRQRACFPCNVYPTSYFSL